MRVDVTGYLSMVRGHWPWLDILAVRRLAVVGKIFRCIDAVHWELPKTSWLREPRKNMGIYLSWLDNALRAAGLTSPVGSKV